MSWNHSQVSGSPNNAPRHLWLPYTVARALALVILSDSHKILFKKFTEIFMVHKNHSLTWKIRVIRGWLDASFLRAYYKSQLERDRRIREMTQFLHLLMTPRASERQDERSPGLGNQHPCSEFAVQRHLVAKVYVKVGFCCTVRYVLVRCCGMLWVSREIMQ